MKAVKRLYRETRARLRPLRMRWREAEGALLAHHVLASRAPKRSIPHTLSAPLIVSFTSYPPRFPTLFLTARCLLSQSVRPDRVVLWIGAKDIDRVPDNVRRLQSCGLEIQPCPEIRSFKKLVPALERWPNAFIATADDDVFYPRTWLADLVAGLRADAFWIPCHRARRLVLNGAGAPSLYLRWRLDPPNQPPSPLTFPIGVGGVLYPPRSLHPDVMNAATFMSLCPTSDDAWFYWMARRAGRCFRRISTWRPVPWPGSQRIALQHWNVPLDNDVQIARLTEEFGFPPIATPEPAIARRRTIGAA